MDWYQNLTTDSQNFLRKLKGKKRPGFYHYSLSGDYFGERVKWGLGNAVFFLKIVYTLDLSDRFPKEIEEAESFIQGFQRKDGVFFDPLIHLLSIPSKTKAFIRSFDLSSLSAQPTLRAETRQAISALSLFGKKPKYEYIHLPRTEEEIVDYLQSLDWGLPWHAGSHFSHLLFFLKNSAIKNKDEPISLSVDWVNRLQHAEDGFWYLGSPSLQQKINGAMKVLTGFEVAGIKNLNHPKKLIDNCLAAQNDEHACDNFNITYVLASCHQVEPDYKTGEIKSFMLERLGRYREYYYPEIGGFSFYKNQASRYYYGALLSRGKDEPDIHGTVMFLWGLSLITRVLKIDKEISLRELPV